MEYGQAFHLLETSNLTLILFLRKCALLTSMLFSVKIKTRSVNVKDWCVLLVKKVSWGNCCFLYSVW